MISNSYYKKTRIIEACMMLLIRALSFTVIAFLILILGFIFAKGYRAINWDFLTKMPEDEMTRGGIFPAIIGTFYLMAGSTFISVPVGIITAVYLNEYARNRKLVAVIRTGVNNLAGIPSVVFGLFGLSLFVTLLDFRSSILAGSLTLGILNLPVIIRSTEEALITVPGTYREASLALGATRLQTIWNIILPNALPGILTGIMLSLGRAAGETAPIMFTAAAYWTPDLPSSIFDEVMALPYHIYVMATAGTHIQETRHLQYGTAIVLITLVLMLNLGGIFFRYRYRRKPSGK